MRVVSVYELRKLPLREALERLKEAEWVLDEGAMFVPSEEFSRILQNSGSVPIRNKHRTRVVRV